MIGAGMPATPAHTGGGFPFMSFLILIAVCYLLFRLGRRLVKWAETSGNLPRVWHFLDLTVYRDLRYVARWVKARLTLRKTDWSAAVPEDFDDRFYRGEA